MKKLAVIVLFLACRRSAGPPPPYQEAVPPNLLELSKGAAVVGRTGEAALNVSAVRAIDGDDKSIWTNPPENLHQTLVFSLPALARIDRLGLTTAAKPPNEIRSAQFALSENGEQFVDAGTFSFGLSARPQLFAIKPAIARYVRVTTLAGGSPSYLQINTVHAIGSLLEESPAASIGGCWTINETPSGFAQKGSFIEGTIGDTHVEGGSDGRFYRFAWIRDRYPQYGLAAVSITPDGKHLSGIVWHEEAIQSAMFLADDWLGNRCGGQAPLSVHNVLETFLQRVGYFPLYGLRFDANGRLDEAESAAALDRIVPFLKPGVRLVSHEQIHDPSTAQTKLDTLRAALVKRGVNLAGIDFESLGNHQPRRPADIDLTRAMYSTVELQIRR